MGYKIKAESAKERNKMINKEERVNIARNEFRHRTRKWFYLSMVGIWVVVAIIYVGVLPTDWVDNFIGLTQGPWWQIVLLMVPPIVFGVINGILWHRAEEKAVRQ